MKGKENLLSKDSNEKYRSINWGIGILWSITTGVWIIVRKNYMHCCQAKTMLNAVPSIRNKFKIIRLQLFAKKNILPQDFPLESKPRLFLFIYNSLWIKILCALRSYFKGFYMDLTTWAPYLVVACLSFVPFPSEYLITCRLITRKRHVMETFGHKRITWQFDKR